MSNPFKAIRLTCFVFLVSLCFALTASAQTQVQESLLYVPVVGQGMGYNIQDLVDIEVSRSGDVITVKRQGNIVFQGVDNTPTRKFISGKIAITSRTGATGPALDEINVSNQALPPPTWPGPVDQSDFTFYFNEGSGNLIHSADGQHWGEVELGWGYQSGEWVNDGVIEGNKSWASCIGAARIHRVKYNSQLTLEGFFKVPSDHNLYPRIYVPLFFMQIQGNNNPSNTEIVQPEQPPEADWNRERGGVFVQRDFETQGKGNPLLVFHIWGPGHLYLDGPEFTYDEWHHVALVRDGVNFSLYLDGEEVINTPFTRFGEANLVKGILNIGQSTDHDVISYRSNAAYLLVDQIRLTSAVVGPDYFLTREVVEPVYVPSPQPGRLPIAKSDNFDDGNADGWTPDSADNWRVAEGVYYVYRGVSPSTREAATYLKVASVWEDFWLDGDFTIYARMGISPTAQMEDPDDPTNMNMSFGKWHSRNYALAFCYQDGFNSYLANFYPHGSWYSGILKYYIPQPEISIWQDNLFFGDVPVGGIESKPLVIENTGDADLVINSITVDNPLFQNHLNQYTLPHTMPPEPHGDTMSVWVAFMSTEPGFQSATITIECNDPDRPVVYVPVCANACIPLPTETANISDDFNDGDFDGWSVDDPDGWEVYDGAMQQQSAGSGSGNLFNYYAIMDDGGICGDFTLTLDIGFNENAYPMESVDMLNGGSVFGRNFAFGIIQDEYNALLGTMRRAYGYSNGIVKIRDGNQSWLYTPDPGYWFGTQGMGLDIHDLRQIKMSRNGDVITVWADQQVIYQARDETSSDPINAGWVVVSTRGPVGVRFDKVVLTPTPEPIPNFVPPEEKTDFTLSLEEGEGHVITSEEGYRGTVEGGSTTAGSFMGWWVDDGLSVGNKSWAAAAGQMTAVRNYTMGSQATIEGWFKFFKEGASIFSIMFNGHWINPDWARERSWLSLLDLPDETQVLNFCLQGGTQITGEYVNDTRWVDLPVDIEFNEWTHLAWVRDGSDHTLYVNGFESGSLEMPRWGDTPLTGVQLTVGNAADHGSCLQIGEPPYMYADQIRVTSQALRPIDFLIGDRLPYVKIDPLLFNRYVAYGLDETDVKERATVLSGNIGSNDDVKLGTSSNVTSNIRAVGDLTLKNKAIVNGDVYVGGKLKEGKKSVITGTVTIGQLEPLTIAVEEFSAGGESFKVKSKGTLDLAPGSYDKLEMKSKNTLNLSGGTYFFNSIDIGTDVNIELDLSTGPIFIYVVENMEIHNKSEMKIVSEEGDASQVYFVILGADSKGKKGKKKLSKSFIGEDMKFLGTVIAPESELWVKQKAEVEGAIYAGELKIGVKSKVTFSGEAEQAGESALLAGLGADKSGVAAGKAPRLPKSFDLAQNYPNPFNPSTSIRYDIPGGENVFTSLTVYNTRGQLVKVLVNALKGPGSYAINWDGRDESGRMVSSGVYIYRIQAGDFVKTRKMVLLK